jgi:hypothetical protein
MFPYASLLFFELFRDVKVLLISPWNNASSGSTFIIWFIKAALLSAGIGLPLTGNFIPDLVMISGTFLNTFDLI